MLVLSFQGIADRAAAAFIAEHGSISWTDIEHSLAQAPSCSKLAGYWRFEGCGFHKTSGTCAEPNHIEACPLPRHPLRNGRLNQTAYSLFFFVRDIMGGDIVAWLDAQLAPPEILSPARRVSIARNALIGPLRHVYGVSDKVLAVALSALLMAVGRAKPFWFDVGASFVAVDTLVHNFLHRTGILRRLDADHAYGVACYRPGGCADLIERIATEIDAKTFNPAFPGVFPRFVQASIWRYCAESGFDVCNGNRIDDRERCNNVYCRLHSRCDRIVLRDSAKKRVFSAV
jgi:hypothetical protein